MRLLPALIALAIPGCSGHPTPEENALVLKIESMVSLPQGGGELKCYERHYTLLEGKEVDAYAGTALDIPARSQVLVGHYRFGGHPGVYWAESAHELPPEIMDGGCDDITVFHLVGDPVKSISAQCSSTFAGASPLKVSPPRTC